MRGFLSGIDSLAEHRAIVSVQQRKPLSVRYDEAGSALEKLYGQAITGRSLDDLYNSFFRARAYEGFESATQNRSPVFDRRTVSTILKQVGYEKLILPFGEKQVEHFLIYIVPIDGSITLREDWESLVKATPWI